MNSRLFDVGKGLRSISKILSILRLVAVLLALNISASGNDMSAWPCKMKITFSGYTQAETLTNFPALVVFTNGMSSGTFQYSQFQSANGWDLRFQDSSETALLNYEIERWATNTSSCVWVQVTNLASSSYIWAYWGNTNAGATSSPAVYTTNGATWNANYRGVWHLNQTNKDSTAYGNNGTGVGTTNAAGQVGGAAGFNGSSYISLPNNGSLNITASITIETWLYASTISTWATAYGVGGGNGWQFSQGIVESPPGSKKWGLETKASASPLPGTPAAASEWRHLVYALDTVNNKSYLYENGVAVTNSTGGTTMSYDQFRIGCRFDGANAWIGLIDEVRISNTARSSNWLWACYMTMASNTPQFMTYGTVISAMAPPIIFNSGATGATINAVWLDGTLTSTGGLPTQVSMFWGKTDQGTNKMAWANTNSFGINNAPLPAPYTTNITGLSSASIYYYRYYAWNSNGEAWATSSTSFTTLGLPQLNNDGGASSVMPTNAQLNGNLTATGAAPTTVTIYWGSTDGGTASASWAHSISLGNLPAGLFSGMATGLTPLASYYYRCYATNAQGQRWAASTTNFSTPAVPPEPPVVDNDGGATGAGVGTAALRGTLTAGVSADVYIYWGPYDGGMNRSAWANVATIPSVNQGQVFTNNVAGTLSGVTNYYRCYASNSMGTAWAGSSTNFTTPGSGAYTIGNVDASGVTSGSAQINASVLCSGAVFHVYAYWGKSDGGTNVAAWANSAYAGDCTNYTSAGNIGYTAIGLLADTDYYFSFRAVNLSTTMWASASLGFTTPRESSQLDLYKYRMRIGFTGYDKQEILTNFPALVTFNTNIAKFAYDQFISTNGWDLRFRNSDGTALLNYEIEKWTTNGSSYIWVQVPQFFSNCYIWAYWGNPSAVGQPSACTTNGATWDSTYRGVWHMTTPNAEDSTSNKFNGIANLNTNAAGYIAGGQSFPGGPGGANTWISLPAGISTGIGNNITVEAWAYPTNIGNSDFQGIVAKRLISDNYIQFELFLDQGIPRCGFYYVPSWYKTDVGGVAAVTASTWYHFVGAYDGSMLRLYRNGTQISSLLAGQSLPTSNPNEWYIGHRHDQETSPDKSWGGSIDEVRISNVARSSNWLWSCFMSQASNMNFNAYGKVSRNNPGTMILIY